MVDIVSQEFYALIGKGVTRWATIDRLVFDIFRIALGVDEARASVCYAAQSGIGNRMKVTGSLLDLIDADAGAHFRRIEKQVGSVVAARNLMAHGLPVFNAFAMALIETDGDGDPQDYYQVRRPLHERRGTGVLQMSEIRNHLVHVHAIQMGLEGLKTQLIALQRSDGELLQGVKGE